MFVIVYENQVVLGPMRWNQFRFENFLAEEYEITTTLSSSNIDQVVIVDDNCKIMPVQGTDNPEFNPTIEMLHGPFWEFTDTVAISSYQVEPLPVDAVKNMLKERASIERYKREISGTTVTIQDTQVSLATDRDSRNIFNTTYLLATDPVNWKFPEGWLTVTKEELGSAVTAINSYVQQQFTWESNKVSEIEAATTLEQLASIEIEPIIGLNDVIGPN